ncbi:S8 family serine peptidase [Albibacterium indicum]|uniref:S8 family serine peptidase n=1 Tax=Albibacterium indicum TaxID=2292082 RepID=UPI000E485730|nr:S8 family serine peptidase [Pedobacter indicus]
MTEQHYYWYKGEKVSLVPNPKKKFLLFDSKVGATKLSEDSIKNDKEVSEIKEIELGSIEIIESLTSDLAPLPDERYWTIIDTSDQELYSGISNIIYIGPSFFSKSNKDLTLSHLFYVKLKKEEDIDKIKKLAHENNIRIEGRNKYMPLWIVLSCDKNSKGNALEMANYFFETGLFSAAEPDLMEDLLIKCVNDTYFPQQWALRNQGQTGGTSGSDIKMCSAWEITSGSADVIVAIVDQGVELNHPDFNNISSISFDSESGTSPSQVLGDHGTAVAGIVGATANNNLGVAGVAPLTTLMSISNSLNSTPNSRMKRADAINFARLNGASIITNSWGSAVPYQVIDDSIDLATTTGRSGLGCVVVFASGNESQNSISYPSNLPNVIAVGASNANDNRASFSNYGTGLDIAAPGVDIYTTDRQGTNGYNKTPSPNGDYFSEFSGTSAAAPFVAGAAALILAIDNSLTWNEVLSILTNSADKVGGYNYNSSGWSEELGFGRLNACNALSLIFASKISGADTLCSIENYYVENISPNTSVVWSISPTNIVQLTTNNQTATLDPIHNGSVVLTATISNICGASKVISKSIESHGREPSISDLQIQKNGPSCLSSPLQSISFGLVHLGSHGCNLYDHGITAVQWEFYNFGTATAQITNNSGYYACQSNQVVNPGISVTFSNFSTPFMITLRARIKNKCGHFSDYTAGFSFQIQRC